MDIWLIAGTSIIVGLSGAMMPGPMLTMTISESARRGFWVGPLVVLGHGLVEALLVVAVAMGLGAALRLSWVGGIIGVAGGAVLLWMAYSMVEGAWRGRLSLAVETGSAGSRWGPALTGGLLSVSNPYWLLWWATIGLGYVVWASAAGSVGLAAFFGGHILADLGWFSLVALLVAKGRHLMNDGIYRTIIVACGLFMAALSVYFVVSGLQMWLAA